MCHRPSHQSTEHLTNNNSSHSAIGLLQCRDAPSSEHVHHTGRSGRLSQTPGPNCRANSASAGLSRRGRRCSTVMPDNPPGCSLLSRPSDFAKTFRIDGGENSCCQVICDTLRHWLTLSRRASGIGQAAQRGKIPWSQSGPFQS